MSVSFFIVFEGLDGCGKDSVLDSIFNLFYSENENSPLFFNKYQNVLRTREPTLNSPSGKKITEGLSSGEILNWSNKEVAKLYIEDRKVHCQFIREALKHQSIVLSSRYDISNYAYQMAQAVPFEWMYREHLYGQSPGCLIPDLTLYFRLPPHTALERISKRGGPSQAFEKKAFLEKVFYHYEKLVVDLAKKDGRSIAVVEASNALPRVTQDTIKAISDFLKKTVT